MASLDNTGELVELDLDERHLGARVDVAVRAELEALGYSLSRTRVQAAFAAKSVIELRATGTAILKPGRKVERTMRVRLALPAPAPLRRAFAEPIEIDVVYEDDHVLVVDKRAGMVVHAGAGHDRGTLVNAVLHHLGPGAGSLPVLPGNDETRPGIVHRLDKDTSGLMVVAKTVAAQSCLARQFKEHTIERRYLGIMGGNPSMDAITVETGHGRDPENRLRFAPVGERRAVTHLQVLARSPSACLAAFRLETGRTHQIRMHAAYIGHPLVGDALYGSGRGTGPLGAVAEELGHQALHAAGLGFRPLPGADMLRFVRPMPEALATAVRNLGLELPRG